MSYDPRQRLCENCGTKPIKDRRPHRVAKGYGRFCSIACSRDWKNKNGDPTTYAGRVREHVRVAEAALGRPLDAGWEVHHENEKKRDNRPENLIICTSHRAHFLLHYRQDLITSAKWLGDHGSSVRLFDPIVPAGYRICVRCGPQPISNFDKQSAMHGDGLRGACKSCRRRDE